VINGNGDISVLMQLCQFRMISVINGNGDISVLMQLCQFWMVSFSCAVQSFSNLINFRFFHNCVAYFLYYLNQLVWQVLLLLYLEVMRKTRNNIVVLFEMFE
jgi:hypothetical protein